MTPLRFAAVLGAMVLLDVVFGLYILETAQKNSLLASVWAAAIQLCNAVVVVSFVRDWRTVFPAAIGAFIGTWLAIELVS